MNLEGKTAIITGGTRGIGFAIARGLISRGCTAAVTGRNRPNVDHALNELRNSTPGARVFGLLCDVRDYDQVKATVSEAVRLMGGLDVLINNAGVGLFSNVADMPVADWRATIETNLSGVFYCCHEAIPHLKQRGGGYIINIGSLAGKNAFASGAAYNASKFGLIGFSEALMQEVRYDHVRVSCVMPGSVNTEFGRSGASDAQTTWKLWPEDVAEVVVNLLEMEPRALASIVELRPAEPRKS
jgi:NAD(P)-dependent dehydrogenase (short-subunit alcohol dehydrogenase family)